MQKMIDVLDLTQLNKNTNAMNNDSTDEEKTKRLINRLFERLANIYPAFRVTIDSQEQLNRTKREWFEYFKRKGILDGEKILQGIYSAQEDKSDFLPKASKFVAWCMETNPELLGFPSTTDAYKLSILINTHCSTYKHPERRVDTVIRHAIKEIGTFEYRTMKIADAKKAFASYYAIAVRDYMDGNIKPIDRMLEDRVRETEELRKVDSVVLEQYRGIGRESAFKTMLRMVGGGSPQSLSTGV